MKHFRKQLNSGDLRTTLSDGAEINGQPVSGKCSIRPGDVVLCDPAALGVMGIKSFVEIDPPKGPKRSLLKSEISRYEAILRPKSALLNSDYQAGIGEFAHVPTDRAGLVGILATLEDEDFNASGQAIGAMSAGKLRLKEAWDAWKYQCRIDPTGQRKLKEPTGEHLEAIALAEAQMNVLKAEIVEVKKRLAAAIESEKNQTDNRAEKMKFKGIGQLREGRFIEMDGRPVAYNNDGLPYFADDGMTLSDYKEQIKQHRAELEKQRSAKVAKEAKQRREQAEAAI